jgi:hypothetical protein
MANGEDIPYQLRPNKYIDRQIFMELLSKIVPYKAHGDYVYVSMGGKHLVDLEAVYRRVGITNLFSFDGNKDVVDRQHCNLPHFRTICEEMHSSALAGRIDEIMNLFEPAQHMIIWLDYTNVERLAQLQEFSEVLGRCQAGDVVRITMNAQAGLNVDRWMTEGFDTAAHYRAKLLNDQIGDFFPAAFESVKKEDVPRVLAGAVSLAASNATADTKFEFAPILCTTYADGQRMFTATIFTKNAGSELPDGLQGWEFLSRTWNNIVDISVPDLSLREKVLIDKYLNRGPQAIINMAKFKPVSELDEARIAILSYKKLHRFYPTFQTVGVH